MRPVPVALRRVWEAIPNAGCKGLCAEACGPIGMSEVEQLLLKERGIVLKDPIAQLVAAANGKDVTCPALVDGRCSVYDVRPTLCRLWGSVENMPCPWGCEPNGGRLAIDEGFRLMSMAMEVGQVRSRRERRTHG